ncbi:hypothetical protein RRG08_061805 [Elysia crispata]|uniref:Lipid-binding serum glycoprotein C-terminal domain-containing protein n=1 Tax=Elysia crispata TaxID=231223 RepID=A0AAE1ARV5_9GAST|nr:hypothetical protein RRG08_061805 [Elysia crispata]
MLRNILCPVLLTLQAGVTLAAVRPSRTVAVPAGSTQLAFVSTGDRPVIPDVAKYFYVDYRLLASPVVNSDYIEVWNKGTVYSKSHKSEPPFSPQSIPASGSTRMVYFWVNQYSFNTLLYQAHKSGLLKCQVTKSELPEQLRSYLNTTCDDDCIETAIPEVGIESGSMLYVALTTDQLTVNVSARVELSARSKINGLTNLASLNVEFDIAVQFLTIEKNLSLTFVPSIRSDILGGKINGQRWPEMCECNTYLTLCNLTFEDTFVCLVQQGVKAVLVYPEVHHASAALRAERRL